MKIVYYAGIDLSLDNFSICAVHESGKIMREAKVVSERPFAGAAVDEFNQRVAVPTLFPRSAIIRPIRAGSNRTSR